MMTRPDVVPEIRLFGVVRVVRRGGTYVVGEIDDRTRRGEPGEETVRPNFTSDPAWALYLAVGRARAVLGRGNRVRGASKLLDALADLILGSAASSLDVVGDLVAGAREAAGISKSELARRARCSRTTVKDVEAGRVSPKASTVARLLDACARTKEG